MVDLEFNSNYLTNMNLIFGFYSTSSPHAFSNQIFYTGYRQIYWYICLKMLCNLGAQNLTDMFDVDYDTFLSEEFDANIYASAIIEESESSTDATDIGTELSKLAFSIDIVNKQIQEQVSFSSLKYGALKGIHINGCHRL